MMKILEITYSLESRVCATVPMARFVHRVENRVEPELPTVPSFPAKPTGAVHVFLSRFYPKFIQGGLDQSPLYGRVTKKYDIYQNNNKKKPSNFGKSETVGTKKNFFYEVFFLFLD